jgi:DNA-binding CsgD family transcriptional regulator
MAQTMLEDGRLRICESHIGCADADSQRRLARLIAHCLTCPDQGGGRTQIAGPDGHLVVQCAPFSADMLYALPQRPSAILMITDPKHRLRQRLRELTARYGLTRAEIELALAVVETGSRKAAAAARGVSDATARAQLTSIFDKTGVRRQTELVRLLMYDG